MKTSSTFSPFSKLPNDTKLALELKVKTSKMMILNVTLTANDIRLLCNTTIKE